MKTTTKRDAQKLGEAYLRLAKSAPDADTAARWAAHAQVCWDMVRYFEEQEEQQ